MKINLKNVCGVILMVCAVVSCDLDTTPTTSLDAPNVYKDTKNAERVLRGAWNYISLIRVLLMHLLVWVP